MRFTWYRVPSRRGSCPFRLDVSWFVDTPLLTLPTRVHSSSCVSTSSFTRDSRDARTQCRNIHLCKRKKRNWKKETTREGARRSTKENTRSRIKMTLCTRCEVENIMKTVVNGVQSDFRMNYRAGCTMTTNIPFARLAYPFKRILLVLADCLIKITIYRASDTAEKVLLRLFNIQLLTASNTNWCKTTVF